MVEPGQDLLLAALSESGISPNDLFDVDGGDAGLATPTPSVQQVTSFPNPPFHLNLQFPLSSFCCCCFVFETGFLCVTVLFVLELALVDQAGLEITETCLPLPPKCWD